MRLRTILLLLTGAIAVASPTKPSTTTSTKCSTTTTTTKKSTTTSPTKTSSPTKTTSPTRKSCTTSTKTSTPSTLPTSSTPKATCTCVEDLCLLGVQAYALGSGPGKADCSSYLQTTVTPATSTAYSTATVSTIPTTTVYVTATFSTGVATTTTISTITTTTQPYTSTITDEEVATSTVTSTLLSSGLDPLRARRGVSTTSSNIPSYATALCNPAHYSSACSCIGITARTITASQPVTTSITTTTIAPSVSTFYTTTSTITTTTSVTTISQISYSSTETDSTAIGTTTTTESTTTTITTQVLQPTSSDFYLTVQYPASQAGNTNIFGFNNALNSDAYYIDFTSALTNAVQFRLDRGTGQVSALTGPAMGDNAFYSENVGASSFVVVSTADFAASEGGELLICSIDVTGTFSCNFQNVQVAAFWLCGGHLNVVQPGYDFMNSCNQGTAFQVNLTTISV